MNVDKKRDLKFVGSTLKDLKEFPLKVKKQVGFELDLMQNGETPSTAKSLKGIPGVMELVEPYNTDTYRVVYIANINDIVLRAALF